jgi:hypothetical protein
MGRRQQVLRWLAAGAAMAAAGAGCSTSAQTPVTTVSPAQAYQATVSAASGAMTLSSETIDAKGRTTLGASVTGVYSWADRRGTFVSHVGIPPGYQVTTDQIVDGSTIYTHSTTSGTLPGGLPSEVPPGWTEETWTTPAALDIPGLIAATLVPSPQGDTSVDDPAAVLQEILSAAGHPTVVGRQSIDGMTTTHYRAELPLSRIYPGPSATYVQIFGPGPEVADYWLDDHDQLRLLQITITIRARHIPESTSSTAAAPTSTVSPAQGSSMRLTGRVSAAYPVRLVFTDRISDYGVAVNVTPPPPSQISSRSTCQAQGDGDTCSSSGTSAVTASGA